MAVNTITAFFSVAQEKLHSDGVWNKFDRLGTVLLEQCDDDPVVISMGSERDKLFIYKDTSGGHASVRVYSNGTITVDVQHYVRSVSSQDPAINTYDMNDETRLNVFNPLSLSEQYIRSLEDRLQKYFGEDCHNIKSLYTPIKRGQAVWPYAVTADERVLEMDYDEVLFDEKSAFQHVQIMHSRSCGNVLLLDTDVMLGESDLIYTQTVCALDTEDYRDKEVLILGGGDGGILHELLKLAPKFVLMAEIDDMVIRACRTHMRSVCGDSMDQYEGPNYKIVLTDCVKVLHETISSGKQYDYVINDLTELPVQKSVRELFTYDFETTSLITELSLRAVKDSGKVLARGNCASATDYRDRFEADVQRMGGDFLRKVVFVPSFGEKYTLYEIWKKEHSNAVEYNQISAT